MPLLSDTVVSPELEFRVYYRHYVSGGSQWIPCDKFTRLEHATSFVRKLFANDDFSQEKTGTHANAVADEEILIERISSNTSFPVWTCSLWNRGYNTLYEKFMIVAVPAIEA